MNEVEKDTIMKFPCQFPIKVMGKVSDDFERRNSFNTAIAAIMELLNSVPKHFLENEIAQDERKLFKKNIY